MDAMPRVFFPQVVKRYDFTPPGEPRHPHQRQQMGLEPIRLVPAFDLSSAAQFGQLTPILGPDDNPMFLSWITPKIREALDDFGENDYFLAVGDPSVIAICAGIILRKRKVLKMLKWDRKLNVYISLEINP